MVASYFGLLGFPARWVVSRKAPISLTSETKVLIGASWEEYGSYPLKTIHLYKNSEATQSTFLEN